MKTLTRWAFWSEYNLDINLIINVEKQLVIKVFGKVQGVWFRKSTKTKADELGLKGVVLDEADGSVYIVVRGKQAVLDLFVTYCKIGPPEAKVLNVIIEESEVSENTSFDDFSIIP